MFNLAIAQPTNEKRRFDFKETPLEEVLKFFQTEFGFNYTLPAGFEANLSFSSASEVNFDTAFEMFLRVLQDQDYTAIRDRDTNTIDIVDLKNIDASKLELLHITDISSKDAEEKLGKIKRQSNEVIHVFVLLVSADAVIMEPILKERLNPPSWVVIRADKSSNGLEIVCTKKFMFSVLDLIKEAEKGAESSTLNVKVETIQIRHQKVDNVLTMICDLLGIDKPAEEGEEGE